MKDEALKLALEAITQYIAESPDPSEEAVEGLCDAASAARKALAKPEQEPAIIGTYLEKDKEQEQPNFCSRCGKRTKDLTHIHTCTPPQEKST